MQTEPSFSARLVVDICRELGYAVDQHPEFPSLIRVRFPEGHCALVYSSTHNVNGAASRVVARDKGFTKYFLQQSGVVVPWGEVIDLTQDIRAEVAGKVSGVRYPCMVKPVHGYQGKGVSRVLDYAGLLGALTGLQHSGYNAALVEEYVKGREYRIVWHRDRVVAAYEKTPLAIVGDGIKTAGELLEEKRLQHMLQGRGDTIFSQRAFLENKLAGLGYTSESIIPIGVRVVLRENANLSTGGDMVDISDRLHRDYAVLAKKISKELYLPLVGIDIITTEPATEALGGYWVLEVAHSPGLQHFASLGTDQHARVKAMYTDLIESERHGHD